MAAVALLGFAFHGYYGNAHEEAELKEEQREALHKKLEGHFHALSKKYFDKICIYRKGDRVYEADATDVLRSTSRLLTRHFTPRGKTRRRQRKSPTNFRSK